MVTILYRPRSEHERQVLEFQSELVRNQTVVRLINVDSREGTVLASLYDIVRYPGVVVHQEDGRVLQSWNGDLPTIGDVSYLAHT